MNEHPHLVEVRAPATIANLGPGFDILGMALTEPFDVIRAEYTTTGTVTIAQIMGDGGKLPLDATRNTAGVSALYVLQQLRERGLIEVDSGIQLIIEKGLPLASGLGSSSASAVGGAAAVNAIFGNPLKRIELLPACIEGEAAVSGRHADNVAPALLGGTVFVGGLTAESLAPLPTPNGLVLALVTPSVAVPTAEARAALPKQVALGDMVQQTAAVAMLIAALYSNDLELLGKAIEADRIIEPARRHLMPGLAEARQAARERGALGTTISGAGPTLFSVCDTLSTAQRVIDGFQLVYAKLGLEAQTSITRPSLEGVRVQVLA